MNMTNPLRQFRQTAFADILKGMMFVLFCTLFLTTVLLTTGCKTRNPGATAPNKPTARWQIYDEATGKLLSTTEDNRGQTALGGGQSFNTSDVLMVREVRDAAEGSSATNGVTLLRLGRSAALAANVQRVKELQEKQKETAQRALAALAAGAQQDYADLSREVIAMGKSIEELIASGMQDQPSGDNKSTELLLLTTAPGQKEMILGLGQVGVGSLQAEAGNRPTFSDSVRTVREDTTTEAETLAGINATRDASIWAAIDRARIAGAQKAGAVTPDQLIDSEDSAEAPTAPVSTGAYDALSPLAKKFLWKSRYSQSLGRGTATIFVPGDRPKIKAAKVTFSDGSTQTPTENYFADSQERQRLVFVKAYPAGAATAVVEYVDGGRETFALPNAHARREYLPGAYKAATPVTPTEPVKPTDPPTPVTGEPANGAPAALTSDGALHLRGDAAALVGKVLVLTYAEQEAKTEKFDAARTGNTWSAGKALSAFPEAVYQIWWTGTPPADVPHHQDFFGAGNKVSHITQAGTFKPDSTRSP